MIKEYEEQKNKLAYELFKQKKLYVKARAIIFKDNKILLLKNINKKTGKIKYMLPGGAVENNETIKNAVVREALEEFGVNVNPIKCLGKEYYNLKTTYNNTEFVSKRVEYYYLCEYINDVLNAPFGVDGEFDDEDEINQKISLSLNEFKTIKPSQINHLTNKTFNKIIKGFKI